MSFIQNGFWKIAVVTALVAATGCQERSRSGGDVQAERSASADSSNASETPKTTPAQEPPVQSASYNSNPPNSDKATPPPPKDRSETDGITRAQAENMIYATIRIKMEEMIAKRAALLKSGRDPSDVEVRDLEGSIMRARELLEENGEIVEPVNPPIVQSTPKQ